MTAPEHVSAAAAWVASIVAAHPRPRVVGPVSWLPRLLTAAATTQTCACSGSHHGTKPWAPAAQVDGCTIEVGGQKDYHSRYKICEFHLKAPVVQKDGRAHRFCQQVGLPMPPAGAPAWRSAVFSFLG